MYKRLTTKNEEGNWTVWGDDYSHPFEALQVAIERLAEFEDKIENGTLIEVDKNLIGEGIIGVQCYIDGTFGVCLDENIVIGFGIDGVVTWNNVHKYNDYFKNGCYFIDNEKGRTQLKAKLRELKGNKNE